MKLDSPSASCLKSLVVDEYSCSQSLYFPLPATAFDSGVLSSSCPASTELESIFIMISLEDAFSVLVVFVSFHPILSNLQAQLFSQNYSNLDVLVHGLFILFFHTMKIKIMRDRPTPQFLCQQHGSSAFCREIRITGIIV